MTKKIETGGSAFPSTERVWCTQTDAWIIGETIQGMTLRDYFATKAMAAVAGQPEFDMSKEEIGKYAYDMADVMLESRK